MITFNTDNITVIFDKDGSDYKSIKIIMDGKSWLEVPKIVNPYWYRVDPWSTKQVFNCFNFINKTGFDERLVPEGIIKNRFKLPNFPANVIDGWIWPINVDWEGFRAWIMRDKFNGIVYGCWINEKNALDWANSIEYDFRPWNKALKAIDKGDN